MTPSQQKKIDRIKDRVARMNNNGCPEKYEFKEVEVSLSEHSSTVYLLVVFGMKGDEGTMAEVFCRFRGHYAIGKRGGVKVLSMSYGTGDKEKKFHHLYY